MSNKKEETKLKIEYLPIDKIKPYERNTRKHEKEDVETIKNSIKEFGMCDPIGIWGKDNTIVEGHGRLIALQELGYKKAPVIRLDHLSNKERKAYGIAHNKTAEMSSWDKELLELELEDIGTKIDMNDFGFDISLDDDDIKEEKVPKTRETKIKEGDMFILGTHKLLCGDATKLEDVERLVGNATIDLIHTDPPYNVGITGSTDEALTIENDNMSSEAFVEFLTECFNNMFSQLKPGGSYYIWYAIMKSKENITAFEDIGIEPKQMLIWVKDRFVLGRSDYQWQHEPCLYGFKEGAPHYFTDDRTLKTVIDDIKSKIDKLDSLTKDELVDIINKWLEIPTTVLRYDKPSRSEDHPTMKPIDMCEYLIKNSTKPGQNVLDCFGGSGSTLIACEKANRNCYMLELDPKYCQVIIDRFIEQTQKEQEVSYIDKDGNVVEYTKWKIKK